MGRQKDISIDFIRILACFFIVWNHTSGHMLGGWGNSLSWANIGVQIFFFMSGFLYSKKEICDVGVWRKKNFLKILKPYWIYLVIIFPVIALLDPARLSWINIVAAYIGVQGFSDKFTIEGLGQHWYISYILLCYALTPLILKWINSITKVGIGGGIGYVY